MFDCCSLLTGIGSGAMSMVAPVYVAEVAAANCRGPLGTLCLLPTGIFLSYAVGSTVTWSWLAVTGAGLCSLHAVLLLIVPESPRWLLVKHDRQVISRDLHMSVMNMFIRQVGRSTQKINDKQYTKYKMHRPIRRYRPMPTLTITIIIVTRAQMGDRGHNRHGPKTGGCARFRGELRCHLTQRRLGRGLPPYQVAFLIHPAVWPQ